MKNFLGLIGAISLVATSTLTVISCTDIAESKTSLDQNGNKVQLVDPNNLADTLDLGITFYFYFNAVLNQTKEIIDPIKNPETINLAKFALSLRGEKSRAVADEFSKLTSKDDTDKVKFVRQEPFTFFTVGYGSINKAAIQKMMDGLNPFKSGTYLFLNIINLDFVNQSIIGDELYFQYIYLIKNEDGSIIGNNENNHFFWYNQKMVKNPDADLEWTLDNSVKFNNVVTDFDESDSKLNFSKISLI